MLDAKLKHYKSITYGIIDGIGTLGGVFEILFWFLMLFYGSIRENMYLFSVINSLISINKDQDEKPRTDSRDIYDTPIAVNRFDQFAQNNKAISNRFRIPTNLVNRQSNWEVSPILPLRQYNKEITKMRSDTELGTRKHPYSYSVLFKSWLPFFKCWIKDESYSKYK